MSEVQSNICEGDCGGEANFFCNDCEAKLCDACWSRQIAHGKGKTGRDGTAHEQTPVWVHEIYKLVFPKALNDDELQFQHAEDEKTIWFGERLLLGSHISNAN